MSQTEPVSILDPEAIFQVHKQAALRGVFWLLGGTGLLGFVGLGFLLAIIGHGNQISLIGMTMAAAVGGFGAIWKAWANFHAPQEIGIGPNGVRIDAGRESRTYGWDQIGRSAIETGLSLHRYLRIYDVKGRKIADLNDAIEDFDRLAELIGQRIAAKGNPASPYGTNNAGKP